MACVPDAINRVYGALEDTTGRFTGRQWSPDSRLNTTHADVALFMLAQNAIIFNIPCDDPWMSAHIPYNFTSLGISGYLSDYYLSLLGCVDQYQICNPNVDGDSGCSILAGAWVVSQDIMSRYKKLDLTALQLATASRFLWTAGNRNLASNVNGRGGNSLRGER